MLELKGLDMALLAILLAFILVALPVALEPVWMWAQEVPEEPEELEMERAKIGIGGGGVAATLLFLDLEELNEALLANGYGPLDGIVPLIGGSGFGGELEDLRFGGLGGGGEVSSILGEKLAKLSLGFGGFLIERGLLARKSYSFSMGLMIGGGSAELALLDHRSSSFGDAIANPPNTQLLREFFAVEAYAGVELALLEWVLLKVNLGYLWTFGGPWRQEGFPLPGPPRSLSAPLLQITLIFGGRGRLEEEGG